MERDAATRQFGPAAIVLMGWLALGLGITSRSDASEAFLVEAGMAVLVISTPVFLVVLPFLALFFTNSFYRERFWKLLLLS